MRSYQKRSHAYSRIPRILDHALMTQSSMTRRQALLAESARLLSAAAAATLERDHDPPSENTPSAYSLLTRRSSRSERAITRSG
jgi:hypothetical protein